MASAISTTVQATTEIECLACGLRRVVAELTLQALGECEGCGYVGWAPSSALTERDRKWLYTHPPETRRGSTRRSERL